jgi:hypothetical protein
MYCLCLYVLFLPFCFLHFGAVNGESMGLVLFALVEGAFNRYLVLPAASMRVVCHSISDRYIQGL